MSLTRLITTFALATASMGWMACGGSTGGAGGSGGTGGTGGGSTSTCSAEEAVSYDACTGTTFVENGTCLNGECATIPLETRTFTAWRAKTKALSGLSDAELAKRVRIQSITHTDDPDVVSVRIEYLVVLDWAKSRQVDSMTFENMPLTTPPTDAEVDHAVALGIESAEWTGLGAIAGVASAAAVQAAFDGCACGMTIDYCHIDFVNVSGVLQVQGGMEIDASKNQCRFAAVDVAKGQIIGCGDGPCAVE